MASKTVFIVLGAIAVVAGGVVYWATHTRVSQSDLDKIAGRVAKTPIGQAVDNATMTEDERRAYIAANVVLEGVEVGADTKEGEKGATVPVPGLLRASGKVTNNGDRPVTPVTVQILLLGKDGQEVLGAYFEEATGGKRLEPKASRAFKFTLPDKKEWGGTFKSSLK